MSDIAILADDLTGACDVAASFCQVAGPVSVIGRGLPVGNGSQQGLEVINLQSRLLSPERCRETVSAMSAQFSARPVIFVKIDAALRGPVGALMDGLVEATGPRRLVVAPAIPAIGRVTISGVQYEGGRPIDKTAHAADPACAVVCAKVSDIVQSSGSCQFEVRDAASDADLDAIADDALSMPPVAMIGSLGLAQACGRRLEASAARPAEVATAERPMIVCGSTYETARRQMARAAADTGAAHVVVDPTIGVKDWPRTQGPLLVSIAPPSEPALNCHEAMSRFMAAVTEAMEGYQPDGLGVVGGETAYNLLGCLHGRRLVIMSRVDEIIAVGMMADGEMAGRALATKGGSVGDDTAVLTMLNYLTNPKGVLG